MNWAEIEAFVLRLIADGLAKNEAIERAVSHFGVSANAIRNKI